MEKKNVNLFLGRFMPFTKGHQSVLEALYKENGYPTVVACIKNTKHDAKHPFDDELIAKEFDTCLKGQKFFEDHIYVTSAAIDKVGEALAEKGYFAHLWGCGTDRAKSFERMASNPKYTTNFADDFKVFVVERDEASNDIDGISATKVREAIKNDDKKEYERMMPNGAGKLYGQFQEQLSKVNESSCTLFDYINNYNNNYNYLNKMKLSLNDYILLYEDSSPWSKTVFSGKDSWEHKGNYSYAKTLLAWLLNKEGVDRPQGLYLGRDDSKEKRIVSFDDLKFSDDEKKQLEEMYNNISKYKYSDLDKILKRFGFKWGQINKKQFTGVGGGDGNNGNQFELDFMNDFDEKWGSKIKEITGCKEIKNKTLDGGKNQKRPYNFNSDGSITVGKEGSYNIGAIVTDITLDTDKGPIYLSLKSGKLLSFANIGCIGRGANQIIPRSWYNSDNDELPERGKNLLNILGIDPQRFKQVFNHKENTSNSNKVKKATYEKEDVTKELQGNKNFLKLIRSCIGCGYIMVHQNQGDDVDFIDLRDESKLQKLTSKVISADVNYPKDAKRVEVHVDMPGIWISFDARPADGGPVPNRIHVRYKFK